MTAAGGARGPATAGAVTLRPMRWWDLEAVLPLEAELFGAGAWSARAFWSELARPQSRHYLVAQGAAGLVGYAGVMVIDTQADVQTLAVAPPAQGAGLGGRLLSALLTEAIERGARSCLLEVRADNAAAIALYRRHGFEQLSLRRRYYQPGDVDAVVMRRRPLAP